VITAGTAARESAALVAAQGAELAGLVVALDREECGTGSNLTAIGQVADELKVPVVPIVTLTDLIGFLEARGRSADAELLREHKAKYGPK
jgi:orotate phosphoribosyltransferase